MSTVGAAAAMAPIPKPPPPPPIAAAENGLAVAAAALPNIDGAAAAAAVAPVVAVLNVAPNRLLVGGAVLAAAGAAAAEPNRVDPDPNVPVEGGAPPNVDGPKLAPPPKMEAAADGAAVAVAAGVPPAVGNRNPCDTQRRDTDGGTLCRYRSRHQ